MAAIKAVTCFLGFVFLAPGVILAVPAQEAALQEAAALEARQKVLEAAESYLGTPYRYAGFDSRGLDCSGLVYLSFREGLNISIPRTVESIYAWVDKIPASELRPGDLVFFTTTGNRVSHVGIYSGESRFIHSASEGLSTGVIFSRLDESYWSRTYAGAGRVIPWIEGAAHTLNAEQPKPEISVRQSGTAESYQPVVKKLSWNDPGFFTGLGFAWTWGGFIEGAPSAFRGISSFAVIGYKWTGFRAALELRPEWDRALNVFRLPLTLSLGNDKFQVFMGPAYTIGEPRLDFSDRVRHYRGGLAWPGEMGLSYAFPTFTMGRGAFSLYGELACQFYHWDDGDSFQFKPDVTANMRVSTGLRYLWKL